MLSVQYTPQYTNNQCFSNTAASFMGSLWTITELPAVGAISIGDGGNDMYASQCPFNNKFSFFSPFFFVILFDRLNLMTARYTSACSLELRSAVIWKIVYNHAGCKDIV